MARRPIDADKMLDRALALVAERGWTATSLSAMATAAKVPLAAFCEHYPAKGSVLQALSRRADRAMLAGAQERAPDEPARDRLFDTLMRRFEALNPHKAAVRAIVRDLAREPVRLACRGPRLCRAMALALEAADIGTSGPRGVARIKGLALVYLDTLRVWLGDDTGGMEKTMAALDRRLRQAESLERSLARWPARWRAAAEAEPPPEVG
ncbi:MAG: helix-turn-helix transcriptional regulator [Alphaproteobacteria bacterium]|nr:helix-turn-helix transcriptional regulator [Alphaproteobacteria bacterium]